MFADQLPSYIVPLVLVRAELNAPLRYIETLKMPVVASIAETFVTICGDVKLVLLVDVVDAKVTVDAVESTEKEGVTELPDNDTWSVHVTFQS